MSIKTLTGTANIGDISDSARRDYAIMLLCEYGYRPGESNPHNVGAYAFYNQFGCFAIEIGDCTQDAVDQAADNGKLDQMAMSKEDHAEYEANEWNDSFMCAGGASEPFWTEYLHIQRII